MIDADVYQGDNLVAHLQRTPTGIRFSTIETATLQNGWLATQLPTENYESSDLHPFFLNLLPEGARLQLLLESSRSKDDSLELLLKVGWDTIGDIAVLPHGKKLSAQPALINPGQLSEVSFWDLFYHGSAAAQDSSIPGVQEKVSAAAVAFSVRGPNSPTAILKLNPKKYPLLVQNEDFFLRMAAGCGLKVNKARLVYDREKEPGLLVARFDRQKQGRGLKKLHQEDGCQLCGVTPAHKYRLAMRQIAEAIQAASTSPIVEMGRLLQLIAFSYIIGNSDLHAKNISLLWDKVARLSPGYDLLSTLPYPSIDQHMALSMNGKNDNFKLKDFVAFGHLFGVPEPAINQMILQLCTKAVPWVERIAEIGFDEKTTSRVQKVILTRITRLSQ